VWGRALDLKLGTAGGTGGRGGVRRSSASRGKQPSGGMSDGRGTTAEKAVCLRFQCGLSLLVSNGALRIQFADDCWSPSEKGSVSVT
jgi:hypothetical protein